MCVGAVEAIDSDATRPTWLFRACVRTPVEPFRLQAGERRMGSAGSDVAECAAADHGERLAADAAREFGDVQPPGCPAWWPAARRADRHERVRQHRPPAEAAVDQVNDGRRSVGDESVDVVRQTLRGRSAPVRGWGRRSSGRMATTRTFGGCGASAQGLDCATSQPIEPDYGVVPVCGGNHICNNVLSPLRM